MTPGPTRVVMSWSGGKDSAMALTMLRADPAWEVVALLTTVTTDYDRVSIHGVRREVLRAQAAALGLPLVEAMIPARVDNAGYESAFGGALAQVAARWPGTSTCAAGDLFLEDVRAYRETLFARVGFAGAYPLWGTPTDQLAARVVAEGWRAVLTCVDTTQLDATFAGRWYDAELLSELPPSCDPCGERGEFHTCVVAGPGFAAPIAVTVGERVRRDGRFEYADLLLMERGTGP